MWEIIKSNFLSAESKKEKTGLPNIELLPDSVRQLVEDLPESIRQKIAGACIDEPASEGKRKISLEEMVASFNPSQRERFLGQSLAELFSVLRLKSHLKAAYQQGSLSAEVGRLLDALWQGRGQTDQLQLFNADYYQHFFSGRDKRQQRISVQKEKIQKERLSWEKTSKQKRLSREKEAALSRLEHELGDLEKELDDYDFKHENTMRDKVYGQDVLGRQRAERDWMKASVLAVEHLDPAEFATSLSEQIEGLFNREFSAVRNAARRGAAEAADDTGLKAAQRFVADFNAAVEDWHLRHQAEEPFRSPERPGDDQRAAQRRQDKVVTYLRALISSYISGKKQQMSDGDLLYTVKQMEVSLTLLKRNGEIN